MASSDLAVMQAQYPQTHRDPSIACGVCDPMNIQNRLTFKRYDSGLITATVASPTMVFGLQTLNLFQLGVGEALQGAPAGALKDVSHTNLVAGGAAADSPCVFTAFDLQVELLGTRYIDASGNEQQLPAMYYDQAYQRQVLLELAQRLWVRIEEPNGCRDRLTAADLLPSDGSSRAVGDGNRSGMLGVSRGLRIAVCFPGQNSSRPFIPVQLEKTVTLTENGANPFPATPGSNNFGVLVRVTTTGAIDTPA